jgi:hypothetical protein
MANIRPDLVASRYKNLPAGPTLVYSFEEQTGIPVDGGKQLLRQLSPFTIKILPPELISAVSETTNVNLRGRANEDLQAQTQSAQEARNLFGVQTNSGSQNSVALSTLQGIVSSGQVVSGSSLTERAVFTDALTAADVAYQVEQILSVPPLTLLVNPKDMAITYTPIQQYQNRARDGFIFERWGENQPTVSFSGTTGGFIAGENSAGRIPGQTSTTTPTGLQWASRRNSAAFQNFVSLYQFYRNNGYIFDLVRGSRAHHMIGALQITYDQWAYIGHISSFSYSYDQNMPNRLEWSMEFTVDRIYDLAQNPGVVLPLKAPSPNPSYPSGVSRTTSTFAPPTPSSVSGIIAVNGAPLGVNVSGTEQFAETPLQALLPAGIL